MSTKAIAELAREIVLSPTGQRRALQQRVPRHHVVREAMRYAKEFLDIKLKRGEDKKLTRSFFVERAATRLDVGIGPRAIDLMERVRIDTQRAKVAVKEYEKHIEAMMAEIDELAEEEATRGAREAAAKKKAAEEKAAAEKKAAAEADAAAAEAAAAMTDLDTAALRDVPVGKLALDSAIRDTLAESGLAAVGNVLDFASTQKLAEIDGIDPAKGSATIEAIKAMASETAIAENAALKSE